MNTSETRRRWLSDEQLQTALNLWSGIPLQVALALKESREAEAAERLQRQQSELERDGILESLAEAVKERDDYKFAADSCAGFSKVVIAQRDAALSRAERLREALTEIKAKYGKVCTGFELCKHESCASSYGAWAVADAALSEDTPPRA